MMWNMIIEQVFKEKLANRIYGKKNLTLFNLGNISKIYRQTDSFHKFMFFFIIHFKFQNYSFNYNIVNRFIANKDKKILFYQMNV